MNNYYVGNHRIIIMGDEIHILISTPFNHLKKNCNFITQIIIEGIKDWGNVKIK